MLEIGKFGDTFNIKDSALLCAQLPSHYLAHYD